MSCMPNSAVQHRRVRVMWCVIIKHQREQPSLCSPYMDLCFTERVLVKPRGLSCLRLRQLTWLITYQKNWVWASFNAHFDLSVSSSLLSKVSSLVLLHTVKSDFIKPQEVQFMQEQATSEQVTRITGYNRANLYKTWKARIKHYGAAATGSQSPVRAWKRVQKPRFPTHNHSTTNNCVGRKTCTIFFPVQAIPSLLQFKH